MQKKSCQRVAKGKNDAKKRVGWQNPKSMMHNVMIEYNNHDIMHHALQALPPYFRFGTLLSLCHPLTRFFCIFVIYFTRENFVIKQLPTHIGSKNIFNFYDIYFFQKCSLYLRRDSNQKIVVLGVHINETCYKTGRVITRDFTV